jgi:translation elongation factor EF-Ts
MAMRASEDTEWNDVQRKFGNLPEKEREITLKELTDIAIEAAENFDVLGTKTLEELDEIEDEEDDKVLEEYRRKRIAEMQEKIRVSRFGTLETIGQQDFVQEVSNEKEGVDVIIHLFQS